jgi:hypothetical protein
VRGVDGCSTSYYEMVAVALKEINSGSDRVAGIVTPAFLDDLLEIVLRNHLYQTDTLLNNMLKSGGKLGDFGIKIDMALLLGIISDRARKDLHRIRRIRNEFAHNAGLDSFNKSPIRDLAMALTIPNWFKGESKPSNNAEPKVRVPSNKDIGKLSAPRGRFHVSCKCFFVALASIEPRAPINPRF